MMKLDKGMLVSTTFACTLKDSSQRCLIVIQESLHVCSRVTTVGCMLSSELPAIVVLPLDSLSGGFTIVPEGELLRNFVEQTACSISVSALAGVLARF